MSMIRRMVKGGFQRKVGSFGYVLSNNDLLNKCKTESIMESLSANNMTAIVMIEVSYLLETNSK